MKAVLFLVTLPATLLGIRDVDGGLPFPVSVNNCRRASPLEISFIGRKWCRNLNYVSEAKKWIAAQSGF